MDFIKNKLIIRPLVASIVPITIYTTVFGLLKITGGSDLEYTNKYAWAFLIFISVLYPLNFIGLWLLFKPISIILENGIVNARKAKG